MQLDAELGSMMNERFNVAGAMLAKLYGRPDEESEVFGRRAGRVRDIAVTTAIYGRGFGIVMSLLAALMSALVYGLGRQPGDQRLAQDRHSRGHGDLDHEAVRADQSAD